METFCLLVPNLLTHNLLRSSLAQVSMTNVNIPDVPPKDVLKLHDVFNMAAHVFQWKLLT